MVHQAAAAQLAHVGPRAPPVGGRVPDTCQGGLACVSRDIYTCALSGAT